MEGAGIMDYGGFMMCLQRSLPGCWIHVGSQLSCLDTDWSKIFCIKVYHVGVCDGVEGMNVSLPVLEFS